VTQFGAKEHPWKIAPAGKIAGRFAKNGDILLNNIGEQAIALTAAAGGASADLSPQGWFDLTSGTPLAPP
jgi:hypothetical protein